MEPIVSTGNNLGDDTPSAETTTEPSPRKRRPGRPIKEFTTEQLATVVELAKLGLRHTIIAKAVDTSPNTLRKRCAAQLFTGTLDADKVVLTTLHDMATSKRCPAATIFWAKTRCGYRSTGLVPADDLEAKTLKRSKSPKHDSDADSAPPKVSALTNLIVYNNDGEPNADY